MSDTEGQREQWRVFAAVIHDALTKLDRVLSERDVPVGERRSQAMSFVTSHMIDTNVDYATLITSEEYARIVALIDEWYRRRYGPALRSGENVFPSVIFIFGTPFAFDVPLTFSKPGEDGGSTWFARPASVQPEEDPLLWIARPPTLDGLDHSNQITVATAAAERANCIRAINFDLRTVVQGPDADRAELAQMIIADLKLAGTSLRSSEKGERATSGWALSQATEKALKLYIRCNGETPRHIHDLLKLADHADNVAAYRVDRTILAMIPSGSRAVRLRYGGDFSGKEGDTAYSAALAIIQSLVAQVEIRGEYNIRNARFLLKPPWFGFHTEQFVKAVTSEDG